MEAYTQVRYYVDQTDSDDAAKVDNLNAFLKEMQVQKLNIISIDEIEPMKKWLILYHVTILANEGAVETNAMVQQQPVTESVQSTPG